MKNGNPEVKLNRKAIRRALRSWSNSQQLGEHSLARLSIVEARRKAVGYRSTPIGYGVALRDVLRQAIKALMPGEGPPDPYEKRWRSYLILNEGYISGRSPDYISVQMGIARSTYDHAHASALDTLADLLQEWDQHGSPEDPALAFLRSEEPRLPRVLYLLPPKPDHPILGRELIIQNLKELLLGSDEQPMVALNGLPGVGKTALAIEIAHDPEVRERYEDGVLWVGLGRQPDLLVLLSQWAIALGLPLEEINKLERLKDRAKVIHAALVTKRMLLVIDDVWEAHEGLTFKIGGAGCAHLMTTRLPKVAWEMAGEGATELRELDEEDGLKLLEYFVSEVISAEQEGARLLVNGVGGLPLALVLMGRYLRQEARSGMRRLRSALEGLRDAEERLRLSQVQSPLEQQPSLLSSEPLSLRATIEISVQALDSASKSTLKTLSILPPKPNSFSEEAALVIASVSTDVLDHLVDFGLLEVHEQDRFTLNRSISEYAGLALDDESAYGRFVDYFVGFTEAHEQDFPAIEIETQNIFAALDMAFERKLHPQLITCANAFYPYLEAVGLLDQAQNHLTRAETAARKIDDMQGFSTTLENLGRTAQRRGDYPAAKAYYQEGLKLARKLDNAKSVCALLQGLGVVAFSRGDYQEAEDYYLQGLNLARVSDQRGRISALLSNMGTLAFSRGDIDQAEVHFMEGLALAREVEDPHISSLLMNLGVVLARGGVLEEADIYFQESLELARAEGNRKVISFLLTNLGALACDRGDEKQAEGYFLEALSLAREMEDRARISHLLANLGGLATTRGDHDAAEGYLQEGLDLARKIGHREYTTLLLINWGVLARESGDLDRGESLLTEALELATEMGHRRFVSIVLSNRGELNLKRDEWGKAEADFQRSLEVAEEIDLREYITLASSGLDRIAEAHRDAE